MPQDGEVLTRGVKQLFACAPKIHPLTDQTSKIECRKEVWVPSVRNGGCHPGGVSISKLSKGGGWLLTRHYQ